MKPVEKLHGHSHPVHGVWQKTEEQVQTYRRIPFLTSMSKVKDNTFAKFQFKNPSGYLSFIFCISSLSNEADEQQNL